MKKNVIKKIFVCSLTGLMLTGNLGSIQTQAATNISSFADANVLQTHWGKDALIYLIDQGAMNGIKQADGSITASPNATITRAEFAKLLIDLIDPGFVMINDYIGANSDDPEDKIRVPNFDFPAWYKQHANVLSALGVGFGDTAADWQKPISRGEVAHVINVVCNYKIRASLGLEDAKVNIANNITDRNSKDIPWLPYWGAIEWLYSNGVLTGDQNGNYNPLNNLTRAEAATILQRLKDSSKRLTVTVKDYEEVTTGRAPTTLRWDDPYRPRPQDGDIFIDKNGKEWKVKYYPEVNGYNIEDPINLWEGMVDRHEEVLHVGYTSDGTFSKLGDSLMKSPSGVTNWGSVWSRVEAIGYGKPTQKGSKQDELSPNGLWVWDMVLQDWFFWYDMQ